MVYHGKPSLGCGTCRKRRIKCDQQRPTCGQCVKSKRDCLGYRNEDELLFVSLNKSLRAKASDKNQQNGPKPKASESSESESTHEPSATVPTQLSETAERQAISFFFSEFIAPPRHRESARSYIEQLSLVYSDAHLGSTIFDATAAAALAVLSNHRKSHELMIQSRFHYGKAVTMLQEAIVDPDRARCNATLMSIMVLGLFEVVTSSNESLFKWGNHANGAMALVRWRGAEEMLSDPLSRRLYWAVRSHAISYHIVRCEPLDPYMNWETLWQDPQPKQMPAITLTTLGSRIPALRAAAAEWYKAPISGTVALKCVEIIGNAKIVDQLLAGWAFDMPSNWRPRNAGTADGDKENPIESFLYPGVLNSYSDLWVASMWNSWRSQRIICNSLILNGLERLLPLAALQECPEYRCAVETIHTMADGLCASVPYHLGHPMPEYHELDRTSVQFHGDIALDDSDRPRYRAPPCDLGSVKIVGAYYLLVPLSLCNSAFTLPAYQRNWIRGRLLYIAKQLKSHQAQRLADMSPIAIEGARTASIADYLPPAYSPYPDMYELVQSPSFRDLESMKESQAVTKEARCLQRWRTDFIKRILDV